MVNSRKTSSVLNEWVQRISMRRAMQIAVPILPWFEKRNGSILDFGSGLGHIGFIISQETCRSVVHLDVRKYPFTCPQVNVDLFDGIAVPYSDSEFDTSLIVFVLHHTPNPKASLSEVMRVTENRIVVCEDSLKSRAQIIGETTKDTITNGFLPHMTLQYKTEIGWEKLFSDLGLSIKEKVHFRSRFMFNFNHVAWLLSLQNEG